jgi:ribosome recycling factor
MAKSVETLRVNLTHVRTGRAHVGLLDAIRVDYYGSEVPVNQVGNVTLSDARTISIQPYEKKMVQVIEKAIRDSDLGVNPATAGDVIRVPMPALTEERRKELVKLVRRYAEDGKVAIRNVRRDVMRHLEELVRNGDVGDDEERRAETQVQKLTDDHVKRIDELLKHKEAEIMEV